jgi:hypothetical protein
MNVIILRKTPCHISILIRLTADGSPNPRYLMKRIKNADLGELYMTSK